MGHLGDVEPPEVRPDGIVSEHPFQIPSLGDDAPFAAELMLHGPNEQIQRSLV